MRLRHTLKAITWGAAALAVAILIIGKDKDYAWIGIVILAAICLHFLIETVVLLKRGSFRRRLSSLSEYKEHKQFEVKDLDSSLSSDALLSGVTIPVILSGTISGKTVRKAPLANREALAYRLVAEPLETMGKVGGQVLLVDTFWGDMTLRDETGAVHLAGPGVLDGSSFKERVISLGNLQDEMPEVASRVQDGLGIAESKEGKATRISLREIALFPSDKVRVYGKADRSTGSLRVQGNDTLDDPESLLVRAAVSPASTKLPRRTIATILSAFITVCSLGALGLLAGTTVVAGLFKPGGLFDATRTGKVRLDLDGRAVRVTIGTAHWDIAEGNRTRGFALKDGGADFESSRSTPVMIQSASSIARTIKNGEEGYPRWDGSSWVMEVRSSTTAASGTASPASAPAPASSAPRRTGRLYVRNLTNSALTIRILGADGSPLVDTSWSFGALAYAGDPQGSWLELTGKGPYLVSEDAKLEVTVTNGASRIIPVTEAARWRPSGSWMFQIAPELSAGSGWLYVKNHLDVPFDLWLVGSDGRNLFGDEPWSFEPREGEDKNKGMSLEYNDKNIMMKGRETIRISVRDLQTIREGTLESLGSWRRGVWTIDLGKVK
ncbi:MAG TPA: hypothetical protein VMV03_05690 [Spirochaetia bacterium]|nr:hypothetical protein [Spirochaetia bacterium]